MTEVPQRTQPKAPRRGRAAVHWGVQLVGFGLSVALLIWVISRAFSVENRENLARIAEPDPRLVGLLFLATGASIVFNGLIFGVLARPVARVRMIDVIGVNAIATFLSILPFKIGFLTRVLIHSRHDAIPLPNIIRWFAANAAVSLAVLLPIFGMSWWRRGADPAWWLGVIAGPVLCITIGVGLCRLAPRVNVLAWASLGSYVILRDPAVAGGAFALRVLDVVLLALRFVFAAQIAGVTLTTGDAAFFGTTFFLASVGAPTGATGFQLAGTVGVAAAQGLDTGAIALVALIVTSTEVIASAIMAGAGAWVLRLDRLLLGVVTPAQPPRSDSETSDAG